jgi:hypothetical protein
VSEIHCTGDEELGLGELGVGLEELLEEGEHLGGDHGLILDVGLVGCIV